MATKVISYRVDMKDYLELLKKATENELSISDYTIKKVFAEDVAATEQGNRFFAETRDLIQSLEHYTNSNGQDLSGHSDEDYVQFRVQWGIIKELKMLAFRLKSGL